jgi:hypothetical protein
MVQMLQNQRIFILFHSSIFWNKNYILEAYVAAAKHDPLRASGRAYARAVSEAGCGDGG